MTHGSHLVFRCDASPEMGTGHIMRCLTLADVWRDDFGGTATFCCANLWPGLQQRICDAGHAVIDIDDDHPLTVADITSCSEAIALVVDGYQFDQCYRKALAESVSNIVTFRDAESEVSGARLVIDTSPIAKAPEDADAMYLCGPDFALISPGVLRARTAPCSPDGILITFGGSDPHGMSLPVTRSVRDILPETPLHVVVGAGVAQPDTLISALGTIPNTNVSHDLPSLGTAIRNATLVITAAGSSLYEVAALSRPMVLVITEDNQSALGEIDWAHVIDVRGNADSAPAISSAAARLFKVPEKMNAIAERASKLVDGRGAHRILEKIQSMG